MNKLAQRRGGAKKNKNRLLLSAPLRLCARIIRRHMVKGIVYFIITTVGLLFGAVQPWIMALYAVLMILAFGVLMWQGGVTWRPGPWVWATVGVFLAVTLFQMIPLPPGWLLSLSPVREKILAETAGILGQGMEANTLAYSVYQAFARWGFVICLGLFFCVCVSLGRNRKFFSIMVWVALSFGIFQALYGLAQVLIPGVGVLWVPWDFAYPGCARGTYICRNSFAGLMEMLWPVALGVTLAQGEWEDKKGLKAVLSEDHVGQQLLIFLMVALMVLALCFSFSCSGESGALCGSVLMWGGFGCWWLWEPWPGFVPWGFMGFWILIFRFRLIRFILCC